MLIISTSKGNQTMEFSQLIEYNMRNIQVKKSYTNVVEKLFLDPLFLDQQSKVLYTLFLLYTKLRAIEIY